MRYVRNGWYGKCGVYMITCLENGKRYIGASVNLASRINQHFGTNCRKKYAKINPFYGDIAQYGRDAFKVEILEYCEKDTKLETERKWYWKIHPEYNLVEPDECPFTHPEVREKSYLACHTEQGRINRIKAHNKGIYRERAQKDKIDKMKPCCAREPDGTVHAFRSRTEAAKWLNRNAALPSVISNITGAIRKNGKAFGFRWEGVI